MKYFSKRVTYAAGGAAFLVGSFVSPVVAGATSTDSDPEPRGRAETTVTTEEVEDVATTGKEVSGAVSTTTVDTDEKDTSTETTSAEPKGATSCDAAGLDIKFDEKLIGPVREGAEPVETKEKKVTIAAGSTVKIDAKSSDGYKRRSETPSQLSESWKLVFLAEDGKVVAESKATPDLEDGVEEAKWSGSLGSVEVDTEVVAVKAVHVSDGKSPNSVFVEASAFCVKPTEPVSTTAPEPTVEGTTEVPEVTATSVLASPETTEATETTVAAAPEPSVLGTTQTTVAADGDTLPRTGSESNQLAYAGLGILGLGGALVAIARRRATAA